MRTIKKIYKNSPVRIHVLAMAISMLLLVPALAIADNPPPPPPSGNDGGNVTGGGAPIGSGLLILLSLGAAYGGRKFSLRKRKKLLD